MSFVKWGNFIKLFIAVVYNFFNKLECFPGKVFQYNLMFEGKTRAYPRVDYVKSASPVTLPSNFRPGWRCLTATNTLAYCKNL
jgi:hypothetical protein